MARKVEELTFGRTQEVNSSGDLTELTMEYMVAQEASDGFLTEEAAISAVSQIASKKIDEMYRRKISVKERQSAYIVFVSVTYGNSSYSHNFGSEEEEERVLNTENVENASDFSGEVVTVTEHVNYARLVSWFGVVPPNANGALGLDEDGNVNGIDREAAAARFSETHSFSDKSFNSSYFRRLLNMKDTINNAAFRGFSKGEVKFSGASFSRKGSKKKRVYSITFNFDVRRNEPAQNINGVVIPAKYGWQVVSPYLRTRLDTSTGKNTKQLVGGWIAEIYPFSNFSELKIGTKSF